MFMKTCRLTGWMWWGQSHEIEDIPMKYKDESDICNIEVRICRARLYFAQLFVFPGELIRLILQPVSDHR